MQRHVLAATATGLHGFITRHGGNADQIFAATGLNGTTAFELGAYVHALELAAAATRAENLGLKYGLQCAPEDLGLIGGVALAAPTLGQALSQMEELFPCHQQATTLRVVPDDAPSSALRHVQHGALRQLQYRIQDGSIMDRRQDAEAMLARLVNLFRHCLGSAWNPEEIHFEHPRPGAWRDHTRAFAAPVYYGRRANALIFRPDALVCAMPQPDPAAARRLRTQLLGARHGHGQISLTDQARGHIRSLLPDGLPRIEAVADGMALPRWTLQRRLAESGATFSDLVDRVRRDFARRYVGLQHVGLIEIADILGYSELSAFSRAFARWFGISPRAHRAGMLAMAR